MNLEAARIGADGRGALAQVHSGFVLRFLLALVRGGCVLRLFLALVRSGFVLRFLLAFVGLDALLQSVDLLFQFLDLLILLDLIIGRLRAQHQRGCSEYEQQSNPKWSIQHCDAVLLIW